MTGGTATEVAFEVTARQQDAYRVLMDELGERVRRRLGLEGRP